MIEQPWLSMHVTLEKDRMYMKLMNGKPTDVVNNNYKGIGIMNVRKRLDLLYPGKNELTITDEADVFIVNLCLQLEKLPLTKKGTGSFKLAYNG